jgi:hypothetical protein
MSTCYHDDGAWWVKGRHDEHPADWEGTCPGCQRCRERHCTCRKHLADGDQACPECVGHVRNDLRSIEDMMAAMPTEAVHRGVNSEAAMLTGPGADPEAWSWRKVTLARAGYDWALIPEDDKHPRAVLGDWERMIREDYDQPTTLEWTVSRSVDYLTGLLTRLSRDEEQDFPLFAREIRRLCRHLEEALHDEPCGDRANVGCFDCGGALERKLTATGFEDQWTCRVCRRRYTYAEYNFALRAALEGRTA